MGIGSIGSQSSTALSGLVSNQQRRADKMLSDMDTDQDGKVSKDEFVQFGEKMRAQQGQPPQGAQSSSGGETQRAPAAPPSADELFAKLDQNGDSSLSVDELSSMLKEMETKGQAGAHGAGGPPPGGPPPGGAPPGGAPKAGGASESSDSSQDTTDATAKQQAQQAADTNHDGILSANEKLKYELSHPDVSL